MIDYILMSDIRTKLLMGTTISAVSVMLVMAVSMGAVQTNVPANSAFALAGHFEIMVENPDGSVAYVQGDNTITGPGKDTLAQNQFDGTTASGPYICTQLGTGTNVALADDIATALTNTLAVCDLLVGGANLNCGTEGTFGTLGTQCTIITIATIDGIGGVDGSDECIPTCTLTEVRLEEASSGTIFAQTGLDVDIVANTQATVTVTYKIAVGGAVV